MDDAPSQKKYTIFQKNDFISLVYMVSLIRPLCLRQYERRRFQQRVSLIIMVTDGRSKQFWAQN